MRKNQLTQKVESTANPDCGVVSEKTQVELPFKISERTVDDVCPQLCLVKRFVTRQKTRQETGQARNHPAKYVFRGIAEEMR